MKIIKRYLAFFAFGCVTKCCDIININYFKESLACIVLVAIKLFIGAILLILYAHSVLKLCYLSKRRRIHVFEPNRVSFVTTSIIIFVGFLAGISFTFLLLLDEIKCLHAFSISVEDGDCTYNDIQSFRLLFFCALITPPFCLSVI